MDELTTVEKQLPDAIEDIARFVLIGTEKLKSLKAEIGAIKKLNLAQEVYDQKLEEQRRLSELIIDASVRIGEFSKQVPTHSGKRSDLTSFPQSNEVARTKELTMKELGFSRKQTHEFETLANNKDIVEMAKQEARDNNALPTRTRVLDFVQKKAETPSARKDDDFYSYMDECGKMVKKYHRAMDAFMWIKANEKEFKMLSEVIQADTAESHLREAEDSIAKLTRLRNYLKGVIQNDEIKNVRT